MAGQTVLFATRDLRKARNYRDDIRRADDLEAQAEPNSLFADAAQARGAFATGAGILQPFQEDRKWSDYQRRQNAILDDLKVKTVGLDGEDNDCNECNWHSLLPRAGETRELASSLLPRAGFTKKAAAAANWEDTEDSTSSDDSNESYGREASSSDRNAGVDSKDDGVGTKFLLRGGEGMYRPPMRGSGEVCPPKEDCEEETQRSIGGRSSCLGRMKNTRPINVGGALASGGGTRANNSYGASTGGQRGCERSSSPVDDEEIVVRFSSVRSTRMKKNFDLRGISGSGASASGGGSLESGNCDSSSGNYSSSGSGAVASGSGGGQDWTGSSAVCLPRNADAGSTDSFSSGATGRLPGAVKRPTLRGSGGFYKPPMRGLGEVCPPKEESKEMTRSCIGGRRLSLGATMDSSARSLSGALPNGGYGASCGGPGGSVRRLSLGPCGASVPPTMRTAN